MKSIELTWQISAKGHALAAGLVIRYFSEQIDKSRPSSFYTFGRLSPGTLRKSSLRILDLPSVSHTGDTITAIPCSHAGRSDHAIRPRDGADPT